MIGKVLRGGRNTTSPGVGGEWTSLGLAQTGWAERNGGRGGAMENDEGVPEGSSRADSCLSTLRFGRVRATIKFAEAVASSFSFFFPNRKKGRNG